MAEPGSIPAQHWGVGYVYRPSRRAKIAEVVFNWVTQSATSSTRRRKPLVCPAVAALLAGMAALRECDFVDPNAPAVGVEFT